MASARAEAWVKDTIAAQVVDTISIRRTARVNFLIFIWFEAPVIAGSSEYSSGLRVLLARTYLAGAAGLAGAGSVAPVVAGGTIMAGFIIWPIGAIIGAIMAGFIIWPIGAIIGAIMAGFII